MRITEVETKTEIGIGFIGAGWIATNRHLPNLADVTGIRLVAVANRKLKTAQAVAEQFDFERVYEEWQKVIEDPQVDAVFICTPPYMHKEMTLYALARGKHVFCQARMALDLEDALEMLAADRSSKRTTMLCPAPNYMLVEPAILQLLEGGQIGEVRHVLLTHPTPANLDPDKPLYWRQRTDIQGINALEIGMVGEVLERWFGAVSSVAATANTWIPERPADQDGRTTVELPDAVTFTGQFASGALLTALFSGSAAGGQKRMEIHGTKSSLVCYPAEPYYIIRDESGEERIDVPLHERKLWTVERDFITAIRQGSKGSPSFPDGVRYTALTQAVINSVTSGKREEVYQLHSE